MTKSPEDEEQTPRPRGSPRNHRVRNILGSLITAGGLTAVATLGPSGSKPPEAAGVSAPKAPEQSKGNQIATDKEILKYSKKLADQARDQLDFGSKQSDGSELFANFVNNPDGSVKYTYLVTIGPRGDIKIKILVGGGEGGSHTLDLSQKEVNGKSVWTYQETASSENGFYEQVSYSTKPSVSQSNSSNPNAMAPQEFNVAALRTVDRTTSDIIADIGQDKLPPMGLPGEAQV